MARQIGISMIIDSYNNYCNIVTKF